jgi:hypothetical protein
MEFLECTLLYLGYCDDCDILLSAAVLNRMALFRITPNSYGNFLLGQEKPSSLNLTSIITYLF